MEPNTAYRRVSNETMHRWLARDARRIVGRIGLDVGAGKMRNRPLFRDMRYIAVDPNETALRTGARTYPDAEVHVATILAFQVPVAVDLAVSTLVFENKHFPAEQTLAAIEHVARQIGPGGSFLFNIGRQNLAYEKEIDDLLQRDFANVRKRVYGRFHFDFPIPLVARVLSWPLQFASGLHLPREPEARHVYYACEGRR